MLNPDKNLYSVAPVGNAIIIGRQIALKGGITRDSALNLIAWLVIATNAKPEEIARGIQDANEPTIRGVSAISVAPVLSVAVPTDAQTTIVPTAPAVSGVEVPPVVAEFMGAVSEEEKKALSAALDSRQFEAAMKVPVIDENVVAKAWGCYPVVIGK